ncbi:MAG: hypothetical protein A2289_23530 [Deltaproteobacteria bacterium RIFOXYA12_FULL_58_15]|nr:MAG: hypothetical protein A2289_23530 [Deltaproteobacteria bacterium RIFOXYA12_FULL_58_15]OGR10435.1 MAG: hypothetical protein A2341_08835 [Deltaproteobacteria bacterium RIFOXYB12_FULL_58_9]
MRQWEVDLASEKDVKRVLKAFVDETANAKTFRKTVKTSKEWGKSATYQFGVRQDGQFVPHCYPYPDNLLGVHGQDQYAFWARCFELDLQPQVEELVVHGIAIQANEHTWEDDETPFLLKTAFLLALEEERYIPRYTELLQQVDLDHGVYEIDFADTIISQYGLLEDCQDLLAFIACNSQHGDEMLDEWSGDLIQHFKANGNVAAFRAKFASNKAIEDALNDIFESGRS